jgi:hypothetical protein
VEKEHFLDLAKNYTSLTVEEAHAVDELQQSYPYSQVVRCIASRAAHDHKFANANGLLAISAVYSTDRTVLKDIMTASPIVRKERPVTVTRPEPIVIEKKALPEPKPTAGTRDVKPAPVLVEKQEGNAVEVVQETDALPAITPAPVTVTSGLSGAELVEEIMSDLTRLQDLKKIFETSYVEFRKKNPSGAKDFEKISVTETERRIPPQKTIPPKKETVERSTSSEKSTTSEAAPRPKPVKATKAPKSEPTELIPEPSSESILNQIAASRKPVLPDSKKQKEQLEIIDQFITKQPTIAKGVSQKTDGADLAESSASLTDSMVSETLVEILLRQGKKEKAIEVLRKLIWKFPQKKAIFAAQIEELRK